MTFVTLDVSAESAESAEALDEQLVRQLVDRVRAEGLKSAATVVADELGPPGRLARSSGCWGRHQR